MVFAAPRRRFISPPLYLPPLHHAAASSRRRLITPPLHQDLLLAF